MADKKKLVKKVRYPNLHKTIAAISLIMFIVSIIGGLRAEVRITTITVRAVVVMLVVALISRIIMRVVASYEEMNGGKA